MQDEFAPDFLSEDFLLINEPDEAEDEPEVEAEEEVADEEDEEL